MKKVIIGLAATAVVTVAGVVIYKNNVRKKVESMDVDTLIKECNALVDIKLAKHCLSEKSHRIYKDLILEEQRYYGEAIADNNENLKEIVKNILVNIYMNIYDGVIFK